MTPANQFDEKWFLAKESLPDLITALRDEGYTVIAPTERDGVILLRPITGADQIAHGVRDTQDAGSYRLEPGDPDLYFEYVVGPDSPKRYFFPPQQELVTLRIEGERFVADKGPPQPPKLALIGIRPCELAGILVQDRVFGANPDYREFQCDADLYYCQAREQALLIAVNCTRPGGTCFCASWGTGPEATHSFDLALTELRQGFVVSVGSERGQGLLEKLAVRPPTAAELELEQLKLQHAAGQMGRILDTDGIKSLLDDSIEHPVWDEVARRCLGCANCTMVCPTCFCSTVTDTNDLATSAVTRTRRWESCFTDQFSQTASGPGRSSIRAKYRQWLRHKLDTWWDQFDCSGCVGCGRCITWCPVSIDLTREVARIRDHRQSGSHHEKREVAS